jgi:phage-related protein
MPTDWKPMPTVGAGVVEIRVHAGSEYRVFYLARFEGAIYVLHLFSKKTRKTSPLDIDPGRRRYREALERRKLCVPRAAMKMYLWIAGFHPPKPRIFDSGRR